MTTQITIKCKHWDNDISNKLKDSLIRVVNDAKEIDILPDSLKEIIVSDSYKEDYHELATKFGLYRPLMEETEYTSAGKICHNKKDNSCVLLLSDIVFGNENVVDILNTFFLEEKSSEYLPKEIVECNTYHTNSKVDHIAKVFYSDLFAIVFTELRFDRVNRHTIDPKISAKSIFEPFQRKVKRAHMQYQSDNDFVNCVRSYYRALHEFLINFAKICLYKVNYTEFDEFAESMNHLKNGLIKSINDIVQKEEYSLDFLEDVIISISDKCFFEIKKGSESIRVTESPKKLFPHLLDVHQRIVGFVDVLGFSNMIREFDKNGNHNVLKDLKYSYDKAIEEVQRIFGHNQDEIESKMFSDCVCISVPFFDNQTDFTYQFTTVMLGLKFYQNILLQKGYLVRGGVAIGSYYSDDNIIFSGGLVKAVEFEKNGSTSTSKKSEKPPRILVSPEILKKLEDSRIHELYHEYFYDSLIIDGDNEVFINPIVNLNTAQKVLTKTLGSFTDGFIRDALSSISSLLPQVGENTHEHILTDIINILDEKIELYEGQPHQKKYLWMSNFTKWINNSKSSNSFNYYKVNFSEVYSS